MGLRRTTVDADREKNSPWRMTSSVPARLDTGGLEDTRQPLDANPVGRRARSGTFLVEYLGSLHHKAFPLLLGDIRHEEHHSPDLGPRIPRSRMREVRCAKLPPPEARPLPN